MARSRARRLALARARTELARAEILLALARSLADVSSATEAAARVADAVRATSGCDRAHVLLADGPGPHASPVPDGSGARRVLPVVTDGVVLGHVVAEWADPAAAPDEATLARRLAGVLEQAAVAVGRAGLLDAARHQAMHDGLTGLPNQTLFEDRAALAVARARRHGERVAIGLLDLDRFKAVNDTYGHRAGDELLIQVADRLRHAMRAPDTVARMGGDEFTLLLPELLPHGEAIVAERLLAAFEAPFEIDGHRIEVSPSIGLAAYPGDGDTPERLLRRADAAMYRAKRNGRNTWASYASGGGERSYDRVTLEADLRRALERRELRLDFQPVLRVADHRPVAVEALVRWSHPAFGVLSPREFLPLAEEIGLVAEIDGWVLRQACMEIGRADAAGTPVERVAVNLSARTLAHPSLAGLVATALTAAGIGPERLVVEVTESITASPSPGVLQALAALRSTGVAVALDDFGRGHSPLADLGDLPLDQLKIDRSFLVGVEDADADAPVLRAVVAMAHELGLEVVAEGVETDAQLGFVSRLGCDLAQGYLLGRASLSTYALGASAAAPASGSSPAPPITASTGTVTPFST